MKSLRYLSKGLSLVALCALPAYAEELSPPDTLDSETTQPESAEPDEITESEDEAEVLPEDDTPRPHSHTRILQRRRDMFKTAGSVQFLERELLETTEYDDPASILQQVPGVYVRGEDGYGLRPNIGIRGVTSERSQKITLLEDGILFGPAPYSAPAGYFFPLMTRMVGMEILKGPAAIHHGPQTIGGAVNVITRAIPRTLSGGLDLSIGSAAEFDHLTGKIHGHVGGSWDWGGALLEVVHLESGGFKQLDSVDEDRPNTGFSRTEVMLKTAAETDPHAYCGHRVELKLGYAREISHETYLGLTDADFEANPWRRYAASALDRMDWDRAQVELKHRYFTGPTDVTTTAYWHYYDRAWRKVNRFRNAPPIETVLQNADSPSYQRYYDILTGADRSYDPSEALMIGINDRTFQVLGLQSVLGHRFKWGDWRHKVDVGLRLHYDSIERLHTEDGYDMMFGRLQRDDTARVITAQNKASAVAVAGHAAWAFGGDGWTFTPGVRVEWIQTWLDENNTTLDNSNVVVLPGLGIHRELVPNLGVFAGVYRGFSPVGPGQAEEVSPESSINWELGARWLVPETGSIAEIVGFWNDYSNLVGSCTFSQGCDANDLDSQFNGGEVTVLGAEASFSHRFALSQGLSLPVRFAYTLTSARFDSDFNSNNPQFGNVLSGDYLPYIPMHQLQAQVGVKGLGWGINAIYTFVDAMREQAGQFSLDKMTGTAHLVDLMAELNVSSQAKFYLRGENLLMQEAIASRRPYGTRPNRPFAAQIGFKWEFGQPD